MENVGDKKAQRSLSMSSSITYFIISLIFNSLGNVLTLVTSAHVHPSFLGSAYWTAGEANLGNAILGDNSLALFWAFLVLGMLVSFLNALLMLVSFLNALLMKQLDWKRIFGNFIFMLPFSIFIQWFSNIFNQIMPDATTWPMVILYTLINFIGVGFIATAISIYQRVNLVLHPADDLMQILRFKYFKGSAFKAMWASYIPPTIFALIAFIITFPSLYNFGIGTLFAFLFQGSITGVADRYVFPNLKHQAIDVGN